MAPVPADVADRLAELRAAERLAGAALDLPELRRAYRRAERLADGNAVDACVLLLDAVGAFIGDLPRALYFPQSTTART